MNINITRILLLSLAYANTVVASTPVVVAPQQENTQQETRSKKDPFAVKEWTDIATKLERLMQLDPDAMKGIHGMYFTFTIAKSYLADGDTQPNDPKRTVAVKTNELLAPVREFLGKVKEHHQLIVPLLKVSLDREQLENEPAEAANLAALTYHDSIFKSFLESAGNLDGFVQKNIITEADYTQICREFQRVFGDLLHYAFPTMFKQYQEIMELAKKRREARGQQQGTAQNAAARNVVVQNAAVQYQAAAAAA